jgi:hypothetical protein
MMTRSPAKRRVKGSVYIQGREFVTSSHLKGIESAEELYAFRVASGFREPSHIGYIDVKRRKQLHKQYGLQLQGTRVLHNKPQQRIPVGGSMMDARMRTKKLEQYLVSKLSTNMQEHYNI